MGGCGGGILYAYRKQAKGDKVPGPLKNNKWELFSNLMDELGNAHKAALGAGYSAKTARQQGSRLCTYADIAKRITELRTARLAQIGIDANWVLKELASMFDAIPSEILEEDGVTLKNIHDWPRHWQKMVHSFEIGNRLEKDENGELVSVSFIKKLKWIDKHKVIQDMGRHTDVQAFQDRLKVEAPEFSAFAEALKAVSTTIKPKGKAK